MKRLSELDNIQLLYDVKADVLQPIDELVDDAGVGCLVDFAKTVWEKSIEKLECEMRHYPKDIPLFVDMISGVKHIISGTKEEELLDILAKDYWSKNVKGKAAFDKYLTFIAIMKISAGASPRELQQILLYQSDSVHYWIIPLMYLQGTGWKIKATSFPLPCIMWQEVL